MRKVTFIVGTLSVALAVVSAACGSGSEEPQGSAGTGAVDAGAPAVGVGGSTTDAGAAGSDHASGGSAMASGGAAENGGAAGASTNLYVDQLRTNVAGACLPIELPFGATGGPNEGRVACTIGELHFDACDCEQPGRAPLSAEVLTAFVGYAEQSQTCGGASGVDCAAACGCELVQPPGTAVDTSSDLYACLNDVTPPVDVAGFCVIDQERMVAGAPAPIGNPELVADCPSTSQRRIRFVGEGLPPTDAAVFIACSGSLSTR